MCAHVFGFHILVTMWSLLALGFSTLRMKGTIPLNVIREAALGGMKHHGSARVEAATSSSCVCPCNSASCQRWTRCASCTEKPSSQASHVGSKSQMTRGELLTLGRWMQKPLMSICAAALPSSTSVDTRDVHLCGSGREDISETQGWFEAYVCQILQCQNMMPYEVRYHGGGRLGGWQLQKNKKGFPGHIYPPTLQLVHTWVTRFWLVLIKLLWTSQT